MNYDLMHDCFNSIEERLDYALKNSDLDSIFRTLEKIKAPTLVSGVGGSSIVATFLAKVLREKNNIISTFVMPRDLLYMDISGYENVIAVSYSGKNIGVDVIDQLPLNRYLFTGTPKQGVNNLVYTMLPEHSYVSVNATIIPLTILLLYYRNDLSTVKEILQKDIATDSDNLNYEVMSGYETLTAATLLESSIVESGMGSCIVHDKYNYCHGRVNITKPFDADLIFFRMDNELDGMLHENLKNKYKNIITIERAYGDDIINDYYSAILSLKLVRSLADNHHIDISNMDELVDNDVLYRFSGLMK